MNYTTFITIQEAERNLQNPDVLFIDCSFSLADEQWGLKEYSEKHIPNAVYADLNKDLSGKIIPGVTGRHPLPLKDELVATFSKLGIGSTTQVIAYDSQFGAMAAARLWWLLKWSGHENAAVLSGGKSYWEKNDLPLDSEKVERTEESFSASFNDAFLAESDDILEKINGNSICLVDSRTNDRYHGQNEIIDPVAGHIPTAISRPFNSLVNQDGLVRDKAEIEEYFKDITPENAVFYCGSGVSAAFNVLLFVHIGNVFPKMYAGSWSEWITDQNRPVEV
ncbi:sulfurtransferase [Pedobacter hartonius]|uniref:Thiosulfate/3-mercaptopyruvate sulfurtransferase n=1 Tax=Pedobacter hartonius TaxID=425514 RepID=A0A1H4BCA5_9SPHI|nr:sulfurtransferase [Pedobacter hartonius]SEA45761.1 thiosulfate/3-mercaptopyruvate sulfurtransferase [Pedobacter hartonius]